MRLLGTLVVAGVLAVGGLLAPPASAPASAAACSGTSGVTVVIGSSVRCAPGDPGTGLAALSAVASVTQVQRQPGFVCRIDGAPGPSEDACQVTPPTTAYWSYWHARPGGSWQYSNVGAGSYDPAPGSVEGWAFGAGAPPSAAPPTGPAPAPSPAPSPSGGGGAGAGGGSGGATTPSSGSGGTTVEPGTRDDAGRTATASAAASATTAPTSVAPTTTAPSMTAPTATAPTSAAATPATAGATANAGSDDDVTASAVRGADEPSGPSLSPVLGGALVLGLGAAAGGVAWRRRVSG